MKKYEARRDEIQIDIYLPHYSTIGIPVEELIRQATSYQGFLLLKKEWLIALKIYVLSQRQRTTKGEKDFLDLISLFQTRPDVKILNIIIKTHKLTKEYQTFLKELNERFEILELNLNKHKFKKLKARIILSTQSEN